MVIGSLAAGVLLQKKILNHYTIMLCGAVLIGVGLMLAFPPEFLTSVYNLAPILAFPGVLLAGIGDPLMTIATLRALYNLQVYRFRNVLFLEIKTLHTCSTSKCQLKHSCNMVSNAHIR